MHTIEYTSSDHASFNNVTHTKFMVGDIAHAQTILLGLYQMYPSIRHHMVKIDNITILGTDDKYYVDGNDMVYGNYQYVVGHVVAYIEHKER